MSSLIKSPKTEKHSISPELPSFFDDMFTRDLFNMPYRQWMNSATIPSVNIKETEEAFEIEMAAPGMEKKDFKIEVDDGRITISSKRENYKEEKGEKNEFSRREFSYQSFSRSFNLPEEMIKSDSITANYTNGILDIKIPKKEKSSTNHGREIEIS